jgi:hypothetical protein
MPPQARQKSDFIGERFKGFSIFRWDPHAFECVYVPGIGEDTEDLAAPSSAEDIQTQVLAFV